MTGRVVFVGAGPGDARWTTRAGVDAIRTADVVVTDALVSPLLIAEAHWDARVVDVGKRGGRPSTPQGEIDALLVREATAGNRVVRLKGGDPGTFGRLAEEVAALRAAAIAFDVVPGITAAGAAAARLRIPLTDRDAAASLTLLTGHRRTSGPHPEMDWTAASRSGTVCVYMGVLQAGDNAERLIAQGVDPATPVAVVRWAGTPRERAWRTTLADLGATIDREQIRPPALWLVGAVAGEADLEAAAATRRRGTVALLRPHDSDARWRNGLTAAGWDVLFTPAQRVVPPADNWASLAAAAAPAAGATAWLTVTSPLAAAGLIDGCVAADIDLRAWAGWRIAAVGDATAAALQRQGLKPDWVGQAGGSGGGAALAERFAAESAGTMVWAAAAESDPAPRAALERAGWHVRHAVTHAKQSRGMPPALQFALDHRKLDAVVWTSPSQVGALAAAADWSRVAHVAIGPTTAAALGDAGLSVAATARTSTLDAIVEALDGLDVEP